MYYCSACKKKFREYQRRCPACGGRCYRSDSHSILLIVCIGVLFLLLLGLIILLVSSGNSNDSTGASGSSSLLSSSVASQPSTESTGSIPGSSAPATSVPSTSVTPPSTSVTPPSTSATQPSTGSTSGIGIYTWEELNAMDKTYNTGGFGAGRGQNHSRPSVPVTEQKKYSQYDTYFIAEDTNVVYLTFDCGYEYYATNANGQKYPVTGKILDVLKEKGIKAVFFVTMDYVKKEPDLVKRMINEGHVVGNHSNNHPVMPSLSIEEMEYEVLSLHEYVLEHFGYKMTLFRPPTGAYSIQSLAVLQNLGYKTVLWSFQHYDYDTNNQPSNTTAYNTITKNTHKGAIFLLHAISEANAAVLGDVIDYLQTEGYSINLLS